MAFWSFFFFVFKYLNLPFVLTISHRICRFDVKKEILFGIMLQNDS
jgi:hypothetical protein